MICLITFKIGRCITKFSYASNSTIYNSINHTKAEESVRFTHVVLLSCREYWIHSCLYWVLMLAVSPNQINRIKQLNCDLAMHVNDQWCRLFGARRPLCRYGSISAGRCTSLLLVWWNLWLIITLWNAWIIVVMKILNRKLLF